MVKTGPMPLLTDRRIRPHQPAEISRVIPGLQGVSHMIAHVILRPDGDVANVVDARENRRLCQ